MKTHVETIKEIMLSIERSNSDYMRHYCKGYLLAVKSELEFLKNIEGYWEIPDDERAEAIKIIRVRIADCEDAIKLGGQE